MRFLIVEDDPDAAEAIEISIGLGWPEAKIQIAETGAGALAAMAIEKPDLILLDINLPDKDGFEVCRRIRSFSNVPIIVISARDTEIDKVKGLELGGDDYITKPFGHMELLARIKAVLRRVEKVESPVEDVVFQSDNLTIDFNRRQVWNNNQAVELTPTEYNLLYYLVRNTGRTLSHQALLTHVWGEEYRYELEYIKVYIRRLRNKLELDPHNPCHIVTEWGVGYRFEAT